MTSFVGIREESSDPVSAYREMVANILRVAAGGGKQDALDFDPIKFAMIAVHPTNQGKDMPLAEALLEAMPMAKHLELNKEGRYTDESARIEAIDTIVSGALRMLAAELLGQRTQHSVARSQLHQGIRDLNSCLARTRVSS